MYLPWKKVWAFWWSFTWRQWFLSAVLATTASGFAKLFIGGPTLHPAVTWSVALFSFGPFTALALRQALAKHFPQLSKAKSSGSQNASP
jgi:hypothetical protein